MVEEEKMQTTIWTITGLFGLIGEIFDELSHAEKAWLACGCGESVRETIEEDIRTYKCEVEKMNEKVENLKAQLQQLYVDVDKDMMIEK